MSRTGVVLAANPAAEAILGAAAERCAGEPSTCCALFGCGSEPLRGMCITELALRSDAPLPDARVDLPEGLPVNAAWLTATRLGPAETEVLVMLRAADRRDRRRRSKRDWVAGAELRLEVLGRTRLLTPAGPMQEPWLDQRPGQLLKLLAAARARPLHVEEIAEALWPGMGPSSLNNVRHFVHVLREHLEPRRTRRAPSAFIHSRSGGYLLDPQTIRIDADEFERGVTRGLELARRGDAAGSRERLDRALALYRGEFIAEEPYAEWAFAERERLHHLAATGLRAASAAARVAGDLEAAASHLQRLVQLDAYDLEAHRELILMCLQRGRRGEAARRYGTLRGQLAREFGQKPGFTLVDLGREVQAQRPPQALA